MHKALFSLLLVISTYNLAKGQDKFCKVWYTGERLSKVQMYKGTDGKYHGKLVWIKDGFKDGKPILDTENPDKSKRSKPWLGLQIVFDLEKKSETEFVNGKVYDPSKGHYYNCKITVMPNNTLELRGYIMGIPFLGKTTTWYFAEESPAPAAAPPAATTSTGK
jgi:uncharacterized protein (DUF2147 family)